MSAHCWNRSYADDARPMACGVSVRVPGGLCSRRGIAKPLAFERPPFMGARRELRRG